MSYTDFKKYQGEFQEIFSQKSKIHKIGTVDNSNLNLILSSAHIVGTLKPILEKMVGGELDDLKVALIPNAANNSGKMEMAYAYLEQFTTLNNMYMKLLDVERWPKQLVLDSLEKADIIAINGGYASNIIAAIDKAGIREEFLEMISSGKPYIGFSAGAMIMSKTSYFAKNYIGEPDSGLKNLNPFGLVDFEVYPHFTDIMLPSIKTMLPENSDTIGYALKDTQAIIVSQGELLQAGEVIKVTPLSEKK